MTSSIPTSARAWGGDMHYRSVADLNDAILNNLHKLPSGVDAVVGIPRSGLIAANLLCLALNVPMADVEGFLAGRLLTTGIKRRTRDSGSMRTVVVIDDSVHSGDSMRKVRALFAGFTGGIRFIFCAVFGIDNNHDSVDVVLEQVPMPRMFQWNIMHHALLEKCCVDIDGVLCLDPRPEENDDGPAYKKFLGEARPLLSPSARIGALVTSRLEKYREDTVAWMARRNIEYNALHMLDLPSQEERVRQGAHGAFKAGIYKKSDAILFIESEYEQAKEIARLSGRPVLCIATQHIIYPSVATLEAVRNLPLRLRWKSGMYSRHWLRAMVRAAFGEKGIDFIRKLRRKYLR
jgi:uncharacterized HAD superfamily protein/adenine/guanine phosphoribosyltransferase-like PRPP-binding protein